MANRRMFSKTITNSSNFLMMPPSARDLYFHLGMNADDDGYCEHFMVMRMTASTPDDLKILAAKNFVYVFDDKVLVITDWNENNFIRSDRYNPSKYKHLTPPHTIGIPNGNHGVDIRETQVRLGKVSIGEEKPIVEKKSVLDVLVDKVITMWKEKSGQNKIQLTTDIYRKNIKKAIKELAKSDIREEDSILSAFAFVFDNKGAQAADETYKMFSKEAWNLTTLTRPANFMRYYEEEDYKSTNGELNTEEINELIERSREEYAKANKRHSRFTDRH